MFARMAGLRAQLEKGEFQEIVKSLRPPGKTPEETEILISALSFLGRLEEAEGLLAARSAALDLEQKVRARFSLGLAFLRASKFPSAKRLFLLNAKSAPPSVQDYAAQGVALYDYFFGQFERSRKWGLKALRAAMQNGSAYTQLLATDLLGHSHVQMGQRFEGLRLLRESVQLALDSEKPFTAESIDAERLIYEAQFGSRVQESLRQLENFSSELRAQSSYTRGNLLLELGRQLTLHGDWKRAREVLDRGSFQIYQYGLRRQELTLQLRLAEVSYRQGDLSSSLHFLQAARRCLNQVSDRAFEIRILGLEIKLLESQNEHGLLAPKKQRLLELSESYGDAINRQMLERKGWRASASRPGEDPLHDFLKSLEESPAESLRACLEHGWFNFLPEILQKPRGERRLVVLEDQVSWVAFSKDGVSVGENALTSQSHRLLWLLSKGPQSKESLVQKVWGYEYDPLRHDSLIYSALSSLRKSLPVQSSLLETTEQGWRLTEPCEFLSKAFDGAARVPTAPSPEVSENLTKGEPLSLRQEQAFLVLSQNKKQFWDIKTYRSHFKVATMTAFRDLKDLVEKGYLLRRGRGRTTCYVLKPGLGGSS